MENTVPLSTRFNNNNNQISSRLRIPYIVDTQRPELELIPAHIVSNYFELHELTDIRANDKNRFLCYECRDSITLHAIRRQLTCPVGVN